VNFTFYKIKISNTSAALEILNDREEIKWACENIKENISLGMYEWKQHKQWYNEERLQFLNQRKQAKMQWLHDSKQCRQSEPYKMSS
jgi:hypothetical protein